MAWVVAKDEEEFFDGGLRVGFRVVNNGAVNPLGGDGGEDGRDDFTWFDADWWEGAMVREGKANVEKRRRRNVVCGNRKDMVRGIKVKVS